MMTKEFLDKHFKFHKELAVYDKNNVKAIITVDEPVYRLKGGHRDIRMRDSEDIVELFNLFGLSLEPRKDIEV